MVPKMFAAADTDYSHPAGAAHCVCAGRDLPEALASIVISSGYLLCLHINTALPPGVTSVALPQGFGAQLQSTMLPKGFPHLAPSRCGRQGATV